MNDSRRIWLAPALPPHGSCWAWRAAVIVRNPRMKYQLITAEAKRGIALLELFLKEVAS